MFALALERKLRAQAGKTISVAVHPGVARSNLFKIGGSTGVSRMLERMIASSVGLLFNSDVEGALPTLYGATALEAEGGGYYGSQGISRNARGDVGPARVAKQASDLRAQERLWTVCEELTGCALPEMTCSR